MAGRGPAPKDASERRRRNKPADADLLAAVEEPMGPELPEGVLEEPWHTRTVAWWNTWRTTPQARTFVDTDWDFLIDTALMHHTMWSKGRWEFAAELRLRAAKFGATPEDRMRLRMEVAPAPSSSPKRSPTAVKSAASRRERLLRAVGDDG